MQTFQLKPSFAGGELTPALYGRTDLQKYDVGAAVLENAIVQRYGGVTRRPGFRHVAQTAGSHKARLIPFSYNAEQNYVLEFTDKKVRVFANGEPLYIDNTLVEVTTPYTEAELPQIKYTQSADMLFLAHPNHHPAAITRTLTGWTWEELDITNGPFDDPNTTDTTLRLETYDSVKHVYTNLGVIKAPFYTSGDELVTVHMKDYGAPATWTTQEWNYTRRWVTVGIPEYDYNVDTQQYVKGSHPLYNLPTKQYLQNGEQVITPIADTPFPVNTSEIWFRADVQINSQEGSEYGGFSFALCFDDDTDHPIGVIYNKVGYYDGGRASGTYISPFTSGDAANYIGPHFNSESLNDGDYSHYSPYLSDIFYENVTYGQGKDWTTVVIRVSQKRLMVYHDGNVVFSYYNPTYKQGNNITHFLTNIGSDCVSNIIIADFDISDKSLVGAGAAVAGSEIVESGKYLFNSDGTLNLIASDDLFDDGMLDQLVRLGHIVPAAYKKGVPGTDDLSIDCVPGASVYVESFGFWEGYFEVFRQDELKQWTSLKKQSGNRTANYNMTFQNDETEIKHYKVESTDFDNSEKEGEDPDQRGYVTIQAFSNNYDGIVRIKSVENPQLAHVYIYRDVGSPKETLDWSLQAWSPRNGYPQAVGFYEDRLVFGGSPTHPQTYWASKTGDYLNFGTSYPGRDDDAITGSLASGKMNDIKAIVSFGEMVMLTSGGEYRVSGSNGQNFTPTTQQARAQEYRGITDVPPVVIGGRILYVQRGGRIIRDLAYSYDVDKYTGDEVNILASHLFDGQEIISMTYQQTPESVLWCVRSDGVLLGMTYIKEQDVYAWHRHTTQGQFIDVCTIPGAVEDELWAVVKRGNDYFVEQMAKHSDNIYTDAAAIYESTTAQNYMDGLTWLANQTVKVVGDGKVLDDETVSAAGRIDLSKSCNRIVTGYGYDTTVTTLPIEMNGQDGTWGSRKKRIQNMCVMFKETLGGWFGFNGKPMDEIKWMYGEGSTVFDGKKKMALPQANYNETLMLTIKQLDPYPMTILSIIPEVLPGG